MMSKPTHQIDPIEQLDEAASLLQEQRTQQLLEVHLNQHIDQRATEREHARLSQKYGEGHPRVQAMAARLEQNNLFLVAVDQEISRSKNRQEPLPKGGWRVQGQVFETTDKPAAKVSVYFSDSQHEPIQKLGHACTDEQGYYAITLDNDQVERGQQTPLYLTVADENMTVLYSAHEPLQAVADTIDLYDVHLGNKQQPCDSPFV